MSSFDILVIILSVTLFIFLVTAIIATVAFIKLVKKLQVAGDSAMQAVENVESITGSLKNMANGSVVAAAAARIWDKFSSKSTKKRSK
ncbi:hypothetical protein EB118_02330 [bacterium]|nr:hypothetical protein [bacterium]NBX98447.1 hypothetical protein [bacterium]NDC94111.1 hypothetical protein [bacterium]NDD83348.1 hypothetical protein [bacterium]NDG28926.1 hypothetical protein [bacterium]